MSVQQRQGSPRETALRELLDQRIVVLDGAWGTMLQGAGLTPADYRGDWSRRPPAATSPATRTCST